MDWPWVSPANQCFRCKAFSPSATDPLNPVDLLQGACPLQTRLGSTESPIFWFNFSNLWTEHVNNSAKRCFQHLAVREMRSRSWFLLLKCELSASFLNHSKVHRQIPLCMPHCINSDLHLAADRCFLPEFTAHPPAVPIQMWLKHRESITTFGISASRCPL